MKSLYVKIGIILYVIGLPLWRAILKGSDRCYVALIYDKKVILVKNWMARDTWRLPGGGVKGNETYEQAVVREVKEELRIVLNPSKLVLLGEGNMTVDRLGYHYTNYYYLMDIFPKVLPDNFEIIDFGTYSSIPDSSQPGLEAVFDELTRLKLL